MELIDKQVLKNEYKKAFVSNLIDKERGIDLSKYANDAIKAFEEFVDSLPVREINTEGSNMEKDNTHYDEFGFIDPFSFRKDDE